MVRQGNTTIGKPNKVSMRGRGGMGGRGGIQKHPPPLMSRPMLLPPGMRRPFLPPGRGGMRGMRPPMIDGPRMERPRPPPPGHNRMGPLLPMNRMRPPPPGLNRGPPVPPNRMGFPPNRMGPSGPPNRMGPPPRMMGPPGRRMPPPDMVMGPGPMPLRKPPIRPMNRLGPNLRGGGGIKIKPLFGGGFGPGRGHPGMRGMGHPPRPMGPPPFGRGMMGPPMRAMRGRGKTKANVGTRTSNKKTKHVEMNKPWVTEAMKNEILKKHKLHQKAKKSKSTEDWDDFKEQRNKVTTMLREAKLEYIGAHPEEDVDKILAEAALKGDKNPESLGDSPESSDEKEEAGDDMVASPVVPNDLWGADSMPNQPNLDQLSDNITEGTHQQPANNGAVPGLEAAL